jgi:2-succinyl-6-hydroxy-2,4-cyclohexadiene-1-carboxylate synthase
MKIPYGKYSINAEVSGEMENPGATLFFIHGFSGSARDWKFVISGLEKKIPAVQFAAIDLMGHGDSSYPLDIEYYSSDAYSGQILACLNCIGKGKIIIAGYSMGGRAALQFAVNNTGMFDGLVLESANPGIADESERRLRYENDIKLAGMIENEGLEKFTDYWLSLPLFATQKKLDLSVLNENRKNKLGNNPAGLANALKGFSTGMMPSCWPQLKDIVKPVMLVTGSRDVKYCDIAMRMKDKIRCCRHETVAAAGHNIHLERAELFVNLLCEFAVSVSA